MPRTHHTLPLSLPPLGLRREQAAEYVCVSVSKFDEMVSDGRMPPPVHIDGRVAWDVGQLTEAWARLRDQEQATPADDVDASRARIDRKLGLIR